MKEIYKNKALCVHADCEMAECCLRQIGYHEIEDTDKTLKILNPNIVSKKADCEYLARLVTVRFARGFKKVFGLIPSDVANSIYHSLMAHFGKNQYYDRRNGKLLLPPTEQEYIKGLFGSFGITSDVFDSYEEQEVWD